MNVPEWSFKTGSDQIRINFPYCIIAFLWSIIDYNWDAGKALFAVMGII